MKIRQTTDSWEITTLINRHQNYPQKCEQFSLKQHMAWTTINFYTATILQTFLQQKLSLYSKYCLFAQFHDVFAKNDAWNFITLKQLFKPLKHLCAPYIVSKSTIQPRPPPPPLYKTWYNELHTTQYKNTVKRLHRGSETANKLKQCK